MRLKIYYIVTGSLGPDGYTDDPKQEYIRKG